MGRRAHLPERSYAAHAFAPRISQVQARDLAKDHGFRAGFDLYFELGYALSWLDVYRNHEPAPRAALLKTVVEAGAATASLLSHLKGGNAQHLVARFCHYTPLVEFLADMPRILRDLAEATNVLEGALTKRQRADIATSAQRLAHALDSGMRLLLPSGQLQRYTAQPLGEALAFLQRALALVAAEVGRTTATRGRPKAVAVHRLIVRIANIYWSGTRGAHRSARGVYRDQFRGGYRGPLFEFLCEVLPIAGIRLSRASIGKQAEVALRLARRPATN